jgi:anti-anti-sigma regulatory factor
LAPRSKEEATDAAADVFQVERAGPILIVIPLIDLRELNYLQIEAAAKNILLLLGKDTLKHVVLDFRKTDYYGSTALGFFVKLWKRVRERRSGAVRP